MSDDSLQFFLAARYQGTCACCAAHGRRQISTRFEAHHVLERKHCKSAGLPLYDPDNALRLCAKSYLACHERHTTHQELVPLGALLDRNIAFVVRSLTPGPAFEYLHRYYAGSDPRVDDLLEQL